MKVHNRKKIYEIYFISYLQIMESRKFCIIREINCIYKNETNPHFDEILKKIYMIVLLVFGLLKIRSFCVHSLQLYMLIINEILKT